MKNNNESWAVMFIICIIFIISLPLLTFLSDSYYNFQTSVFSSNGTLLFVNNKVASLIIFFSPSTILLFIILRVKKSTSTKIMRINFCSFIAILTFVISSVILVCQFFDYSDIGKEEIHVRSSLLFGERNYTWSDVKYAEVSYESGNKGKIDIIYNIYLDDGKKVNVRNCRYFFDKIIDLDNFMKDKKIKINRSGIHSGDYNSINNTYNNYKNGEGISEAMQVVLKILNG